MIDARRQAAGRGLELTVLRRLDGILQGDYRGLLPGHGFDKGEARVYLPGDDVRHIDWNVTARMNAPFVKEHREERELTVMLVVDVSASGAFGSTRQLKNEVAAEIAAVFAYVAVQSNDRVGLILFSDAVEKYIPPKKGRSHVWRVIREILNYEPEGHATDLEGALEFLTKVASRRVVGFVISDFLDQGFEDRLKIAARRHDLVAVSLSDRREQELPAIGLLELEDAETGEVALIDSSDRSVREQLKSLSRDDRNRLRDLFRASGVGQIEVSTSEPYVDTIVRFFRARDR